MALRQSIQMNLNGTTVLVSVPRRLQCEAEVEDGEIIYIMPNIGVYALARSRKGIVVE